MGDQQRINIHLTQEEEEEEEMKKTSHRRSTKDQYIRLIQKEEVY